jgi:hypothetical protein
MDQMEVIKRSPTNVKKVHFLWHLDVHNLRLAGRWLYYGLYRMLVLTSGCVLLTGNRPVRRLGGFQIISQMMGLINVELTCACSMGHLDHRDCPYHYDLRDYVGLAVRVMRVCCWRLGGVDALTSVGGEVERARSLAARAFVRGFCDAKKMGLCPIC